MRAMILLMMGLTATPSIAVTIDQLKAASLLAGKMKYCAMLKPNSDWPPLANLQKELTIKYAGAVGADIGDTITAPTIATRYYKMGANGMSPGDCQPNSPASSTWFMEYLKEHPDNQEYYLHLSEIANK